MIEYLSRCCHGGIDEPHHIRIILKLEYNTNMVRFIYTSMTTPRQIFDHEMSTGKSNMVYEQSVPSGHNAQDYITKRLWAPIEGVDQEIPITILYHKDTPLDGHLMECPYDTVW